MRRDQLALLSLGLLALAAAAIAHDLKPDDRKTLLESFLKADVPSRLELLPRLTAAFREKELPPAARYLVALQLLRPHLTWHAPHLVQPREIAARKQLEERYGGNDSWRWSEALGAEPWMFPDVPARVRDTSRTRLTAWRHQLKRDAPKLPDPGCYAWRLKDPKHPDVARAVRLLSAIREGELGWQARRWVEEIGRNNTVLTLDVVGSYGAGKAAPVVLDARNAPLVNCRLFRVRRPEDLLWVSNRIGKDFVFHDHGLQDDVKRAMEQVDVLRSVGKESSVSKGVRVPEVVPDALRQKPVWHQQVVVADLKFAGCSRWERWSRYEEEQEYREGDGRYFGDDCGRYQARLDKSYRPAAGNWSSWQCDRVLEVPGKALAEAGVYVLAVESGGQTAYAPLLVEPLSLALRRCRDGVFVAVSDTEGKKPVTGATVHGKNMLGSAETDAEGIAFARVYAGGDRAVIVHKDGRFAIGGFGRVFEGIYHSPWDRESDERLRFGKMGEAKMVADRGGQAQVYSDRHVIAAYTDRPVYRPDQEVQFKVIVRRLAADAPATKDRPHTFRAEDFELASRLEVPQPGPPVPFALLDPKGRTVAEGNLTLNEFGTAAGKVRLNAEAAVGTYSLRLHLAAVDRVVPGFCSVEYYRLPAFKLDVKGVPEKVQKPQPLRVELAGNYYFGKPVAGGTVEVRLTRAGSMRSLERVEAVLDSAGQASVKLEPGKNLSPGRYIVRCDLSDESGRSVRRLLPFTIEAPPRPRTTFAALPRFVSQDQPLTFATTAPFVLAVQVAHPRQVRPTSSADGESWVKKSLEFTPLDGKASLRFPSPGWYTLLAGKDRKDVFVYGGSNHPSMTRNLRQEEVLRQIEDRPEEEEEDRLMRQALGWVDLTEDADPRRVGHRYDRGSHLLALFDRQEAKVGETLRVLVYVPAKQARLLFTLEGYTILDYVTTRVANTRGHYHVIDLPIKRRHLPHCYLRGRILEGAEIVPDERAEEQRASVWKKSGKTREATRSGVGLT